MSIDSDYLIIKNTVDDLLKSKNTLEISKKDFKEFYNNCMSVLEENEDYERCRKLTDYKNNFKK